MSEEKKIILPTKKRSPLAINPSTLLIYGPQKSGKTAITVQLPNALQVIIGSGESADFVEAMDIRTNSPKEFEAICNQIIKDGCPYDYVVFDTVTSLDEWSEIVGTLEYMQQAQGKRFNLNPDGTRIPPTSPKFETVHSLGNGSGYKFSRDVMNRWYNLMTKTAKYVIFIAHIKDKFVESKNGDTVESTDINLTGKTKANYCIRTDAVAHFHRMGNKGFLNFDNENKIVGGRCSHLDGDILISEKQPDGSIKTFWENIYLKE